QESSLELLLRAAAGGDRPELLSMVTTTLDAMASGGIYDHLGGGFARYSTDAFWMVPHFEKMLYNQALLGRAFLHAWQLTGEQRYRQGLAETLADALRGLHHPDGGLSSAVDLASQAAHGSVCAGRAGEIEAVPGSAALPDMG